MFVFDPPLPTATANCTFEKKNDPPALQPAASPRFKVPTALMRLHKLFPHRHISGLRRLLAAIPQLKPNPRTKSSPLTSPCTPCAQEKMTHAPHVPDADPPPSPLQKITLDTGGPCPKSVRGFFYINPLTDAYSYVSLPLPTKTKEAASQAATETLAKWKT